MENPLRQAHGITEDQKDQQHSFYIMKVLFQGDILCRIQQEEARDHEKDRHCPAGANKHEAGLAQGSACPHPVVSLHPVEVQPPARVHVQHDNGQGPKGPHGVDG